jgi:hypothetical protein
MLAIIYLAAMIYFGDRICRCFYRFASIQHRLASAFLTGLMFSTCITYLGTLAFARFSHPLIAGNLVFVAAFAAIVIKLPRNKPVVYDKQNWNSWDWLFLGIASLLACWLIFVTLGFKEGSFQIPFKAWSDFGANLSLTQSFAIGNNFPPEHPFFPGETVRYHFLFWFQAANFEFLGLNVIWGVNLLSLLSFVSLLILIRTFAELLFDSAPVGRIASLLFFFSTSLSYIPFLRAQSGLRSALHEIYTRTQFLPSGYPYRGEDWGVLTVDVFANQRHLISAVGLLFVVLCFLVNWYNSLESGGLAPLSSDKEVLPPNEVLEQEGTKRRQAAALQRVISLKALAPFICSGLIIGALPYWNSAIFVSSMILLVALIVLLPSRLYVIALFVTALLVALPQVWLFRHGAVTPPDQTFLFWGYTLQNPSVWTLTKYLVWTFGFKWLLVLIALVLVNNFHRRMFLAVSSLLAVVFLFQLSTDVFNNHKLLNVWAAFASIYAAYALWRISKLKYAGVVLACLVTLATVAEGVINLFPVRNDSILVAPYRGDALTNWVLLNTEPTDIFLTQTLLTHPILFSGRRIYLGYTLFAWTAGYNVPAREEIYRRMFEERDPVELANLLRQNKIAYVGIDDGVRNNRMIQGLNESVYEEHFRKVFDDTNHRYDNIVIYKVPE